MTLQHITPENNIFKDAKVAVVGDVMLDTFVYGSVERISPEAPVPVVSVTKRTTSFGGAGNVAANLSSLGATPLLIGRIGNDAAKETLFDLANGMEISTDHLATSPIPTTSKTRVVSGGQQIVRVDDEVKDALDDLTRSKIIEAMKAVRKETDVVVVSDYDKGVVDQALLNEIKKIWQNGTVLVDPKPRKNIDYSGVTSMTPNLAEAAELSGEKKVAKTDEEAAEVAQTLVDKLHLDGVLFTRAGDGMTLHHASTVKHYPPAHKLEVRDVSGAGDTVISVLASSLASKLSMEDAVELANICGGLVVAKTGTATLTWDEVVQGIKDVGTYPPYTFR